MNAAHERTQKTLPFLCREYNRREGCSRFDCQELHYCSHFLLNEGCTAQGCTKVHDQETPRNVLLLERLGWCGPGDMQLALDSLRRQVRGQAIRVCLAYNAGCCTLAKCYRLNVCYRHVLDGCPLDDCELSHDVVGDQHNSAVLAAAGLDDTPVSELLQRLTRQLRRRPPQPAICRSVYRRPGGCDRHCLRFHCCEEFVHGQCRYEDKCFKGHSLQDPHNQRVLRFFGWTESWVLAALATEDGVPASLPTYSEPRTEGGDGDDDGDRATQSVERHQDQHGEDSGAVITMNAAHKKTTQKTLPLMCKEYNRREGCARFNCQELHLCLHFLLNKCLAQEHPWTDGRCSRVHDLETPRNIVLLERLGWCGPGDMQLALDSLRRQVRDQAIGVCMTYNFGCCMQTGCCRLHVCYRHVLDVCPLDDCELSHDVVGDQHNSAVLSAAGLDDATVSELLQRLSEQLRRRPPYPTICRFFYGWPGGCQRHCLRFHCCEEFARGQCRYRDKCFQSHSLRDPHNQRVFRFSGWTESWVLAALAVEDYVPASLPTDSEPRAEGGDGDDDGDGADQPVERHQDRHGEESRASVEICVNDSENGGSQRNRTERPAEIVIKYPERYHQLFAQRAQQRQQQQQTQSDAVERLERERAVRRASGADGCLIVSRGRFDASRVLTAIGSSTSQPETGALKMDPGGGSSWSFGSKMESGRRSGPAVPAQPEVRSTPNMFDMLQEDGGDGVAMAQIGLGPGGPSGGRTVPTRGSTGREGAKAAAPAGSVLKGPATMNDEKMKKTVRLICGEYMDAKDFKTTILYVEEKLHSDTIAMFVGESLNKYVDARSTDQRHLLGKLHCLLLESGHLTADAYLTGAKVLLEIASDLACDIPSLWANIGELLAPPLTAGMGVTLEALTTPAANIVDDNYGGKFVTGVLKRLKSLHGAEKVRALVPSNFDWKLYFGSKDHVDPLINSQLGFLLAGVDVPLSPEEAPPKKGVRSLLRTIQQDVDAEAWFKQNINEKDRTSAAFIKDMVCALCFDCIVIYNGAKRVLLSRLEKRGSLLKCLILNEDSELVALYGVLALTRHLQYPPGVLDQCFRQLYDMDVISYPAFLRWREGKEPAEQEGMGVALSGLQAFFKALEEDAAGDDDERT